MKPGRKHEFFFDCRQKYQREKFGAFCRTDLRLHCRLKLGLPIVEIVCMSDVAMRFSRCIVIHILPGLSRKDGAIFVLKLGKGNEQHYSRRIYFIDEVEKFSF